MSLAESALAVALFLGAVTACGLVLSAAIMAALAADHSFWAGMEWPRVILVALAPIFAILGVWALSNVPNWPWP